MRERSLVRWFAYGLVGLGLTLFVTFGAMAGAAEEVRIGILSPMTGPAAKFGQIEKNTLTMAIEDVNNAGGIKSLGGAKVRLVFGDTRGEADIGVTETERLITKEKVHALIGAFQSGVGFPASAVAERYQIPWLTYGTFDKITQRGFRYVFRAHANDSIKARTLIEGLAALGKRGTPVKSAVVFSENTEWGKSVGDKQKTFLEGLGVKVHFVEHYPYAAADLTSMVVKAKGLKPDLVVANSYLGDALLITRHMNEQELRPMAYAAGGGGHLQPDFLKGAGKLSEGILVATMWDAAVGKAVPWIKKENDRHVARFGMPMTEDSAGYYQAFQIIVDALERIKTLSPKDLRDAIAATNITDINHKAMLLPYKQLKFDETGQNPNATAMVAQIQDGKFRLVYPEHVAEPDAKLIWPYPMSKP
ncbi:MAG: ABC transporter substrate-binding protein [candidate division NC10 bacterium]|nr:ABC transporter substrate-binding protein [candidate division NC10 bacterium]MBI2115939.1 ABC transporter substrate-binding protein [candidate division NC10 bacterium]MBI2456909.1 ABC transporter substrate-binding protein [candidate division NC10 bacterium]MBI2562265.1 ABC transporter substrate-binding protein [candidate division NC10 bacterium]MBI3085615.1 ABC transporter substrate-binding protein [candidate division NC10 bacterium]